MTEQEVRAAYAEKYKAFPDLVERILGQFDYKFWSMDNEDEEIDLDTFRDWAGTMEGSKFWGIISRGTVTRESIDAAYAEFGIENTKKMETKRVFTQPVAMIVPDFLKWCDLANQMIQLGYIAHDKDVQDKGFPYGMYTYIVESDPLFAIVSLAMPHKWLDQRTREIENYNPELFLALAAMSGGDEFYPGEYGYSLKDLAGTGSVLKDRIYKIQAASNQNGVQIEDEWVKGGGEKGGWSSPDNFRKATAEEIIAHFSKKEEGRDTDKLKCRVGDFKPRSNRSIAEIVASLDDKTKEPSFFDQVAETANLNDEYKLDISDMLKKCDRFLKACKHDNPGPKGEMGEPGTREILESTLKEAEKLHMPKVDDEIYVWDANVERKSKRRFAFMCPDGKVATYQLDKPYAEWANLCSIIVLTYDHYQRLDEPVFVPMEKAKEKFAEIYGVPASLIVIED